MITLAKARFRTPFSSRSVASRGSSRACLCSAVSSGGAPPADPSSDTADFGLRRAPRLARECWYYYAYAPPPCSGTPADVVPFVVLSPAVFCKLSHSSLSQLRGSPEFLSLQSVATSPVSVYGVIPLKPFETVCNSFVRLQPFETRCNCLQLSGCQKSIQRQQKPGSGT